MHPRRGPRPPRRPRRRRAGLLAGGLGLAALVALAGGLHDVPSPGPPGLPGAAAAPPPGQPPLEEEAPDAAPAPLVPGADGSLTAIPGRYPGPAAARWPAPSGPHLDVPVLLYHYVRNNPHRGDTAGFRLSVTPANFAAQVALLRAGGAHTISLGELTAALRGRAQLPSHPVALTFDDGYADFATTVAPLLSAGGMTATDFVVSGFVGRPGYMSAAQVREVQALGMTIGAHTVSHVDLTRLPPEIARAQIELSRERLEELTGASVDDFAYPYGRHDPQIDRIAEEAGFRDAVSTTGGRVQYLSERFRLRRTSITGLDTLASFAAKVRLPLPRTPGFAGPGGGDPGPPSAADLLGLPPRRR